VRKKSRPSDLLNKTPVTALLPNVNRSNTIMELNIFYIVISPTQRFCNKNYKYYRNIHSITIYNKHFGSRAVTSSAAVTTLLLVAGVG